MPYILNNTDGSLTITVPDSTVDINSFSLALVGRSVSNYGQYFAQNTIRHLENFASETRPSPITTLVGQLWYDKKEKIIRVWDGNIWKRSTGIVVGPANDIPTTDLSGGGAAFFNTSDDKLYIHNGFGFQEAVYPGQVTSEYSELLSVDQPSSYGTRLRTLFLNGTPLENPDGTAPIRPYPVLALCSVKSSGTAGAIGLGKTQIGQYAETIICIYSDFEFVIADDTQTPVDGELINYNPELTGPGGIAAASKGRPGDIIYKGQNLRTDNTSGAVVEADKIFVNEIRGLDGDNVNDIFVENITVYNSLISFKTAEFDSIDVSDTASIAVASITDTLTTTNITTGAEGTAGTLTGQWTLVGSSSLEATFADLAEHYVSDEPYEPGTVIKIGGDAEVTETTDAFDAEVFGVVSTNPAYVMNAGIKENTVAVALQGRVPVKVVGTVKKGERLVSSPTPGTAWALGDEVYDPRCVIGRSLEDKDDGGEGTVEAVIGVK